MPELAAGDDLRVAYYPSPTLRRPADSWVVARFDRYLYFQFGYPNAEVLGAHPMVAFGLRPYGVFELERSPLVRDISERNKIHPRHIAGMFTDYRHWIFSFQDETLDVIAKVSPTFEFVSATSAAVALEKRTRG